MFTTTYPTYRIVIEQLFAATAGDTAQLQVRTSGGTQTASYYGATAVLKFDTASIFAVLNASNLSAFPLNNGDIGNSADTASSFSLDIARAGINDKARWFGLGMGAEQGKANWFGGYRGATETVTGFKILASTSNITGTVAIYGYGV